MPKVSARQSGFSFIVDLTQFTADAADRHLTTLASALRGSQVSLIAIVASAPHLETEVEDLTLVETGAELNPVSRIGLAMQLVTTPLCLVSATAVSLSAETVETICSALASSGVVDLAIPTTLSLGSGSSAFSSRTVVFGMNTRLYRVLRGFDLRIRTVRDAYNDFCRRVRAWGADVVCVCAAVPDHAVEPPQIELTSPQVFNFTASKSVFVNMPRWLYLPFGGDPLVSVIQTPRENRQSAYEAVAAQSFDDYELIEADSCDPAAFKRAIGEARGELIAVVGPDCVTPPWRLAEQLQSLRARGSYSVGSAAFLKDDAVCVVPPTSRAQPLTGPDPAGLGTILAHRDVVLKLLSGNDPEEFTRIQSNRVVAAVGSSPWETEETQPAESSVAQRVLPYLNTSSSAALMLFDQYAVGRIDYIGAYERIAAIATIYDHQRKPVREMAAVHDPTQEDIDCLARLGIPFELIVAPPHSEPAGVLVGELLKKRFRRAISIRPLPGYRLLDGQRPDDEHLLYLRVPGGDEGWFALADSPPGTGSSGLTTSAMFSAQGQVWEQE